MNKEYYVYGAYGLHGELLYIGKGSGNRCQHLKIDKQKLVFLQIQHQ